MARYIDADKMMNEDKSHTTFPYNLDYCDDSDLEEWVNSQPTADVVEVVRCKNCAYWDAGSGCTTGRCESPRNGLFYEYTDGFDFCSYGERK